MPRRARLVRWSRFAVIAAAVALTLPVLSTGAQASIPVPDCDVDCFPPPGGGGGGGVVGEGGVAVGGSTVVLASSQRSFLQWPGVTGANDVAAGVDGSVWVITASSTFRVAGGAFGGPGSFAVGGRRLSVDPSGLPWMVGFDGHITRGNANGTTTSMPGLARDIGVGAQGSVWVIGTNAQNGSFEAWSWNGSSWIPDPGSGQEIDVDSSGRPIVNGSDYKIWIKDGGANQGWSLLPGRATDMAMGRGTPGGFPGSSNLWIIGHDPRGSGYGVWTYIAFNNTWTLINDTFGGLQIAVGVSGGVWVVQANGTLWTG